MYCLFFVFCWWQKFEICFNEATHNWHWQENEQDMFGQNTKTYNKYEKHHKKIISYGLFSEISLTPQTNCSRVGTLLNYAHWNLFNDLPQFERHFWFHIYIYMLNFSTTIDRFCMTMNESLEWSLRNCRMKSIISYHMGYFLKYLSHHRQIIFTQLIWNYVILPWNN
jgi:hypothetical protein